MSDGKVTFDIVADNSSVPGTISDTTRTLEQATKQWSRQMDEAGKSSLSFDSIIQGVGMSLGSTITGALKNAGKAAVDFAKQSIAAASDLAEVQNVVDVTFEESASEINAWAKSAASSFGLTELQAKRFSSTLGAMMKSSGLAGAEVTKMSKDLSGLAADMASFYNLDFDTAFDKIRAGISGETEPLKQLGINMSVANLNAFALAQGLTKTFDKMSQGEQIQLRYQYLMQATADAQGDFARTSDGYANSVRRIETAWESIKASVGELILTPLSQATNATADLLEKLTTKPKQTIFEQINAVDIDTESKIKEIEATAEKARGLVSVLQSITPEAAGLSSSGTEIKNALDSISEGVTGASNATTTTAAKALPGYLLDISKHFERMHRSSSASRNWSNVFGVLIDNVGPLSQAIGKDKGQTLEWLRGMKEQVDGIDEGTPQQWRDVFNALIEKIPALEKVLTDTKLIDSLGVLQTSGDAMAQAEEAIKGSGDESVEAAAKHKQWLEACRQLVAEIPGLSTIIDTETGAIKGGMQAVSEYIDNWEKGEKKLAYVKAQAKKQAILDTSFDQLTELEVSVILSENDLKKARTKLAELKKALDDLGTQYNADGTVDRTRTVWKSDEMKAMADEYNAYLTQVDGMVAKNEELHESYDTMKKDYDDAKAALEEENKALGITGDQAKDTAGAVDGLTKSETEYKEALENVATAMGKVGDYEQKMRDQMEKTVESTVAGFEKMETKAELTAAQIQANLASQSKWITEYMEGLNALRELGASDELIAFLSDGTKDSANYVAALRGAGPDAVKAVSDDYKAVQQQKQALVNELTGNKLRVDKEYEKLTEGMKKAVEELNMSTQAGQNVGATIQAMIDAINAKYSSLSAAVSSVKNVMAELGQLGLGGANFLGGESIDGSFARGLDYVPFDGFRAELHQGEMILTAEQAAQFRDFGAARGAANSLDLDGLSSAVSDAMPDSSAAVYMDGEIVGRMVSRSQGAEYRSLERSGWR